MYLEPDARSSIFWLGPGTPRNIRVGIPAGSSICISRIDVVTVHAAA